MFGGVINGFPNSLNMVLFYYRSYRTDSGTLPALDTYHIAQIFSKCGTYHRVKTSFLREERPYSLHFVAHRNATATLDTLGSVSY
jgi:hypothetical protein